MLPIIQGRMDPLGFGTVGGMEKILQIGDKQKMGEWIWNGAINGFQPMVFLCNIHSVIKCCK